MVFNLQECWFKKEKHSFHQQDRIYIYILYIYIYIFVGDLRNRNRDSIGYICPGIVGISQLTRGRHLKP